jgi:hypothetical protein
MDVEVTRAFGPQYMAFLAFVGRALSPHPAHSTVY